MEYSLAADWAKWLGVVVVAVEEEEDKRLLIEHNDEARWQDEYGQLYQQGKDQSISNDDEIYEIIWRLKRNIRRRCGLTRRDR